MNSELVGVFKERYGVHVIHSPVLERNQAKQVGDTILMGTFDDEELWKAAAYHELGHYIMTNEQVTDCMLDLAWGQWLIECHAWLLGYAVAKSDGFPISPRVKDYPYNCLNTYLPKDWYCEDDWETDDMYVGYDPGIET